MAFSAQKNEHIIMLLLCQERKCKEKEMEQTELIVKGPFTFLYNKDTTHFIKAMAESAYIICTYNEGCSEKENLHTTKALYQRIKRTGFRFRIMLCNYCEKQVICFAIPRDSVADDEETEKMMQWLVYLCDGGWYTKWQRNILNDLWDEQRIIGYRVSHNTLHAGKLRLQGELC